MNCGRQHRVAEWRFIPVPARDRASSVEQDKHSRSGVAALQPTNDGDQWQDRFLRIRRDSEYVHRAFDTKWLASSEAKFELVTDQSQPDAMACIVIDDPPQQEVTVDGNKFCAEPK